MRGWLLGLFGLILSALIVFAVIYSQKAGPTSNSSLGQTNLGSPVTLASPATGGITPTSSSPIPSASPAVTPSPGGPLESNITNLSPDLSVDVNGLSKATVILTTDSGVIHFKFYSNDAPKTVKRIIELVNKGFYNGLIFHRVVPGFVIQGGDPVGNGTGGSGQKLDAEFNNRKHIEGSVAMARASDPNSADSQFYISLGTFPHLDHSYTVFGQVVEGMDVVRKIKVGDKMMSVTIR